jgi:ABC-2 type transport system ATP-binding protein
MADIPAAVIEIEADETAAARAALVADDAVRSVAQLGTRLHALLDPAVPDPAGRVTERLRAASVAAQVTRVHASLEDVFVAATGFGRAPRGRG